MTVACSTQGICFKLLAALAEGNKEDVAADVFAEDGQHLGAAHLGQPGGLDVACAGDAEARVALEIGLEQKSQPWSGRPRTISAPSAEKARVPRCWPAATSGRGAVAETPHWRAEHRRRPGPPSRAACRAARARFGAHPAACAGSGTPRALHPPRSGAGMWYCLDSSRLSKVVRVARFHYSPGVGGAIPPERRGEPVGLRKGREQRSGIRERALSLELPASLPRGDGRTPRLGFEVSHPSCKGAKCGFFHSLRRLRRGTRRLCKVGWSAMD